MLRALFERQIRPDLIVGTSVGALNGAFVAFDPTDVGVARLSATWQNLEDEDLYPGARFKTSWARMLMRGNRVFESSGLKRMIEAGLGPARFEDAKVPLAVVATELEMGTETLFTTGELLAPLLATTAMPSIFPPVQIDGRSYIDGGVTNNVPVSHAVAMGARKIYVLNCSGKQQQRRALNRPMDYLLHAFMLARSQRLEVDRPVYAQKADVVYVPTPELTFSVGFTSLARTKELLELGYERTIRFLDGEDVAAPAAAVAPVAEIATASSAAPATATTPAAD